MRLAIGEIVDHRYVVRSLLDLCSFCETYRAVDRATGTVVLLKVPQQRIAGDMGAFKHFRREIDVGTRLKHPGIQRMLDRPRNHGVHWPYLVLEYVEGETLRSYLQDRVTLRVDEVIRIGSELAVVLSYVHEQGIVHRQITPENILISRDGGLKLTEFGFSHRLGPFHLSLDDPSTTGAPDYMAPEQMQGSQGDMRTDVYALGAVLYELLAGRVPYPTEGTLDARRRNIEFDPPLVRSVRTDVPMPLEAVICRALRQNPKERYQSMLELHQDLVHLETLAIPVRRQDVPRPRFMTDLPVSQITLILVVFTVLGILAALAEIAHRALTPH